MYAHSDKNQGPVTIKLIQYIKDGLKHLTNTSTYMLLTKAEALQEDKELQKQILQWCTDHSNWVPKYVPPYLWKKLTETAKDPFGYLYLLYKIHKPKLSTRLVCSGQWVDEMLQPIVQAQHTYFKNLFALKQELNTMVLPLNASLFTYDAVSIYTHINTEACINWLAIILTNPTIYNMFK